MRSSAITDAVLWEKFKEGEEWAFSEIYLEHARPLYLYGLKFTSNSTLIEDVIQELFLRTYDHRRTLGPTDNIRFYLLSSFRRMLLRTLKKESHLLMFPDPREYVFEVRYSIEHDIILNEELKYKNELLIKILKTLSPHQREAIYLRFSQGLNYEELSQVMAISVEAGRNLIYRAVRSLRKAFKDTEYSGLARMFNKLQNN